jgi:hypothetical protein
VCTVLTNTISQHNTSQHYVHTFAIRITLFALQFIWLVALQFNENFDAALFSVTVTASLFFLVAVCIVLYRLQVHTACVLGRNTCDCVCFMLFMQKNVYVYVCLRMSITHYTTHCLLVCRKVAAEGRSRHANTGRDTEATQQVMTHTFVGPIQYAQPQVTIISL